MVTRKKKVRKSKKEAFQSVLLAARPGQESIPLKSDVSSTSTEDQECSSKSCQKRQIQLFVNSSLTSPVCLQLHPSTTISALKGLLQDKVGIEPEKQHLFTRKNHELRDDLSLANYGIEQDTNIELRLVSGLMGGDDKQKTAERKKTKRRQKKSGKKSTSTKKMIRQSDSDEEFQVRSTDESGDSPTTTGDQSTGRKKRRRRRRQNHVEKEPSCEEGKISTTLDQDDSSIAGGSATNFDKLDLFLWILCLPLITIHVILSICSPRMIQVTSSSKNDTNRPTSSAVAEQEHSNDSGNSSTSAAKLGRKRTRRRRQGKARRNPLLDEAERQTTSDDEKQDHLNDLGKSDTSAGKPGKIRSRGKTKKKSGKTRKGKTVAMKSSSEEEAIDKTSKGDQDEDKLVNSKDSTASSSAKTTAKRNNQSKGRKRTRRRRQGKARQKVLFHEAEKQTSSDDEKRDPSNAFGESYTLTRRPGKVHRRGKTKTYSGKRRKAQNVAKKSSSKEEAIDKTSTGDEAENKLVNSRDSTVSSSAKTTAKRNNQPKGRKKTKKQTNADKKPSCEEKKESQIQLFVISSLRSPVCLQLHPSTTISALKGLLQEKMGIEPKKQRLYTRRNHELKGRMSLKELGIQQDTNIELRLVSGLMGGADDEQKSAGDSRERTDSESGRRQKGRRKKGKRKATQRRTSQGAAENVDHSDVCSISSAVKAPTGNPSVQTQEEKLEQPKKKNDSRRRRRGKRKATKRTGPGGEENDENSEHSSSSSAVKTPTGHPSGETHERKPEQPKKDNDSGKRQKVKATKTWTTLGGEDDSEDSLKSSAVKASAGNPSGETPEQNLEQPCKDNDSGRRHKEKRKATKTGTSLVDEYNSEDSSISSSVKASAGQPSGETQVQQKPEQPRKENNSRRRHKGKRKAIKTRTSLGDEDNSENSSIPSAVKAAAGHPSGETQTQKLKKPSKSNSGRIQNTKTKAAETKTSLGGEENVNNLEESSISSAVKAPADHPSEETQEQRLEQSWKDNESGRRQNGDKKGTVTGTSHGGEENVGNSEDSSISSTVKAGASNLSGETEEQKLQQPRKDNDSGSRQQGERQATKKRTSLVGEDNSEDSFISSGVKAPTGHPSGQAREDKLEQPRKDNDSGIIQKGKRKATKTRTSSEREENSDNSEESSTSTAAKEPAVCQSGETQTKKQEKPSKDNNSRRIQQGKRTAAEKSPSEAETNTKSLGDTKQQILHNPGDSCSSATIGTAASASSETVAGSRMKRERRETAGSEAEESQEKTVASDRQQADTGSSPVSPSVTASSGSRSRGWRRRTRRKRKSSEDGDTQVLDLDILQPEDQNVAGVMELNLQQGKGTALEQQRPKDQKTEKKDNLKDISSSETQSMEQEKVNGPDRFKADDSGRDQKEMTRSSQLQTLTSPEHPTLRRKQDDGPDRPPELKNKEARSQKSKQELVKQSCQQGLTVPERHAVRQEQTIETDIPQREPGVGERGFQQVREASPGQRGHELSSHQGIATRENRGAEQEQASLHAQLSQQDIKQKVAGISEQNIQQSMLTSPEHQRMRQERDDDLYGPDPKIQSSLEAGEQSFQAKMMTSSAEEKPGPDRLHKDNLPPEQMQGETQTQKLEQSRKDNNSGRIQKGKRTAANKSPSEAETDAKSQDGTEQEILHDPGNSCSSAAVGTAASTLSETVLGTRKKRESQETAGSEAEQSQEKTVASDRQQDDTGSSPVSASVTASSACRSKVKIRSKGKTKKRSEKARKGQKLAKKSPSEKEAIDKTSKGDKDEDQSVNSRDSSVSSSAKITAKRNNQSKGRNKTRRQTNAYKKPSGEEKKESQIQLFVISSLRPTVCLQLHPSTTISALKGLLQDKLGIEPEKQHLYTRKKHELKDGMSLKELGIRQDTNIELRLVSGLMGGADDEQKSTVLGTRKKGERQETAGSEAQESQEKTVARDRPQQVDIGSSPVSTSATASLASRSKDYPRRGGASIGSIGTISGNQNPVIVGSSGVNITYTLPLEGPGGMGNNQHPAKHIQPEVSSPSVQASQDTSPAIDAAADAAADLCEEALKKAYKTQGSYVQMIPWVDDDMRHIMKIYTNLRLVSDDDNEERDDDDDDDEGGDQSGQGLNNEKGKEVTYQEAFLVQNEEGLVINRIIYEGLAGLGKTTLIGKIAYDWATGSSGPLAKYKLVFVLRMSALEQIADLIDSLYEQLIDPNIIDKKHLETFIFKNPKKVLILLDGFDELMTTQLDSKSFGSILQILNRKVGADIDVVITTRTSHFGTLVSKVLIVKPFTHVKVLGFSEKEIPDYLKKFFSKSKSPRNAESLFQTIKSSGVFLDLARSPMLLLLLCLLWKNDSTLPNTISRLYGQALRYIFKRKGIPEEEIPEILVAIGKVAFHGLVSPLQRLSFQEREFEKSVLDKALMAYEFVTPTFVHLILQFKSGAQSTTQRSRAT